MKFFQVLKWSIKLKIIANYLKNELLILNKFSSKISFYFIKLNMLRNFLYKSLSNIGLRKEELCAQLIIYLFLLLYFILSHSIGQLDMFIINLAVIDLSVLILRNFQVMYHGWNSDARKNQHFQIEFEILFKHYPFLANVENCHGYMLQSKGIIIFRFCETKSVTVYLFIITDLPQRF